ncbi:type VI secretion protein [Pseudomonas indica]|uniref:Type VI secretion system protein n=1 Tax=Pseudomonas indica TaxID=137658 RepID=A0A1G8ZZI1_9PSED|nr:type VI secretion protein [Pseudomonas indica]SDK20024.1 type VI secretion system protein [Pseudomonas indica]
MRQGSSFFVCVLPVLAAFLALSGCSLFDPKVELDTLRLDVAARANDNTPIAVDFIAVRDAELLKQLSGIPARQWFAEREQFRRDYRTQLSVWSLELVPGQFMESNDFPLAGEPSAGLLVFAGYNTPGVHRLRLDDQRMVWLKFESRDMRLLSGEER